MYKKTITGMSEPKSSLRDGITVIAVTVRFNDDPEDEDLLVFLPETLSRFLTNLMRAGIIKSIPETPPTN